MNFQDILALSFKDLKEKKVRTALTVIMVVIGVASIVALIALTEGISASISGELNALGPTTIIVSSSGTSLGFTQAAAAEIQSLPNVSTVVPLITGSGTLRTGSVNETATIIGIDPQNLADFLGSNVSLYQGTMYAGSVSPASVVGYDLAYPSSSTTGLQSIIVGQPISLKVGAGRTASSYTIPVVGILNPVASSFIISADTGVIMSLSAAETLLHKTSFNTLIVKSTNATTVGPLANTITTVFGSAVRVETTQELAATAASIIGSISTLLVLIAGISLVVAAIGIMNIMLISVYERVHEIGIMKSVGFSNRYILLIFIFQALIIGFFGGIAGIVVGAGGSYTLSALISGASASSSASATSSSTGAGGFGGGGGAGGAPGGGASFSSAGSSSSSLSFTPVFSISTILTALIVAMTVSVIAGVYPAWRASKLEPIEALRQL